MQLQACTRVGNIRKYSTTTVRCLFLNGPPAQNTDILFATAPPFYFFHFLVRQASQAINLRESLVSTKPRIICIKRQVHNVCHRPHASIYLDVLHPIGKGCLVPRALIVQSDIENIDSCGESEVRLEFEKLHKGGSEIRFHLAGKLKPLIL